MLRQHGISALAWENATSYNNLALVYESLGEYSRQAKELNEKAMMRYKKVFGDDHPYVATSYDNLASVYNNLGNQTKAKEFREKALMIRKKDCR